jgi:NAD(P)-dependent dehydrogenase (short-subunit alcohol dehydrogenase family)
MSNSVDLLKGKKVIVIGGSAGKSYSVVSLLYNDKTLIKYIPLGIGHSVAAATLAHGASVVISSSSQGRVDAAVERLKQNTSDVSVKGQAVDLSDFTTLKAFLSHEGPFDHLVKRPSGVRNDFFTQPYYR